MGVASEKAVAHFQQGFSCSQAVLAVFAETYGLDERMALRVAGGFGGGIKCGEVCGVFSGAVMVVGLKYGTVDAADKEAKALCGDKTAEFVRLFRERFGHVTCRGLLGCDIATPEGRAYAVEHKLFTAVCPGLVRGAAELLEALGY